MRRIKLKKVYIKQIKNWMKDNIKVSPGNIYRIHKDGQLLTVMKEYTLDNCINLYYEAGNPRSVGQYNSCILVAPVAINRKTTLDLLICTQFLIEGFSNARIISPRYIPEYQILI